MPTSPAVTQRHLHAVPDEAEQSMSSYLERWLSSRRSLRPSTRQSYDAHIRLHINPRIGHIPLAELTRADLEQMFDELLASDGRISPSTVVRVYATLSSALNHAVATGAVAANPAVLVELPTRTRGRPEPWTAAELAQFLSGCTGDRDYPLFALLGLRGLRRGEALGLTWADVDLDAGTLRVRQQLSLRRGRIELSPPKSRAGLRSIALDSRTCRILYLRGCQQRLDAKTKGWEWSRSSLVFTEANGSARNPLHVTRRFQALTRELGLREIRLHDLRHTSASLGLASGETLLEVSRRLGHSSLAITADIYSEILPETATASAERLSQHVLSPR